ncbi:MAG: hypothetical protein IPF44_11570 [Betaproteobacteria bacterium]|nr:hypothetical protein [Betaproteobacteria bacterium]
MRKGAGYSIRRWIRPSADDARFADPIWVNRPAGTSSRNGMSPRAPFRGHAVRNAGPVRQERRRSAFWLCVTGSTWWRRPFSSGSTRWPWKRFVETSGGSLKQEWENFQRDVKAKNILMVEPDAFKVGEDLATTPGKGCLPQPAGWSS